MRTAGLSILLLLAACLQERGPATAIAISVKSDLRGDELSELIYRVSAHEADPGAPGAVETYTARGEALARPFLIEQGRHRTLRIAVEGSGAKGRVAYETIARFEPERTTALQVFLGRACLAQACAAGETCFGRSEDGGEPGTCGPVPLRSNLVPVRRPGDEHAWEAPVDAPSAGPAPPPAGEPTAATADCTVTAGLACDPLRDCGCLAGQHCQLRGGAPVCATAGVKLAGARCEVDVECGPGLACSAARTCAPHCASDADCDDGTCVKLSDQPFGTCFRHCADAAACGANGACSPLQWGSRHVRACFEPHTACPFQLDGRCDEPETGTGLCRAGSDADDCACDPVSQRGCPADRGCTVIWRGEPHPECVETGTIAHGHPCERRDSCARGLVCVSDLCHRYCEHAADCGGGNVCIPVLIGGQADLAFRVCQLACTPGGPPCAPGSHCSPTTGSPTGGVCERDAEMPPAAP